MKGVGNLGACFPVGSVLRGERTGGRGESRPQPTVPHTGEGNSSSFEMCSRRWELLWDLISLKNVSFLLYL